MIERTEKVSEVQIDHCLSFVPVEEMVQGSDGIMASPGGM
jgi:hypothetical protein